MDIMMSRSFVKYLQHHHPTEDSAGLDYSIPSPTYLDLMLWLVLFPDFFMSLLRCT